MKRFHDFYIRCITGFILCIALFGLIIFTPYAVSTLFLAIIFVFLLYQEWLPIIKAIPFLASISPVYPITPMLMILYLNTTLATQVIVLKCFAIAFAYDTFCYIFGRLFGKHLIIPPISKGKTWEGFLGGWISLAILLKLFLPYIPTHELAMHTLTLSIIATGGDLFESAIKRKAHLKDSGYCLPGHGGLLDRFDSAFFLIYFYWLL